MSFTTEINHELYCDCDYYYTHCPTAPFVFTLHLLRILISSVKYLEISYIHPSHCPPLIVGEVMILSIDLWICIVQS